METLHLLCMWTDGLKDDKYEQEQGRRGSELMDLMTWTQQSSDTNPIEHVWD